MFLAKVTSPALQELIRSDKVVVKVAFDGNEEVYRKDLELFKFVRSVLITETHRKKCLLRCATRWKSNDPKTARGATHGEENRRCAF